MNHSAFINGDRIYLRSLDSTDVLGSYADWFNDEEVCSGNSHYRFPMLEIDIAKYIETVNRDKGQLVLAVIEKGTDTHIGNVALQNINYINRSAEFAIIIGAKEFQKKGYGKQAAYLIINHGFLQLNLHRIYCGTLSNNNGMKTLAESLGFKKEGVREQGEYKNGEYIDIVEYGLLRERWK